MIPNTVRFWSFLVVLIPSILCSLFALYYLLFNRPLRLALNNHVIIVLLSIGLICEITIYPWMIYFSQYQGIWERSFIFCQIWGFIDCAFIVTYIMLLAWATIERHILIFHNKWLSTKTKRIFIHYLPIMLLTLYSLIFYITIYFLSPCETIVDQSRPICYYPCLLYVNVFVIWDGIIHQIVSGLIIVVFSIALLVRVLWQKYRIHRSVQWRKQRKMAIQLLYLSFLFLIFYFPFTVVYILSLCGIPYSTIQNYFTTAGFLVYFIILSFPFACVFSLPELRTKLINIFYWRRQARRIQPKMLFTRSNVNKGTHVQ